MKINQSCIVLLCSLFCNIAFLHAQTFDTIRNMRAFSPEEAEAYSNVGLACPEIELPSVTGNKANFRYIDAGCEASLTIRPTFGVSGGKITGYTVHSIPYAPPFPFNRGERIFIDQDDVWGNLISLPFKFVFWENTYSSAVVGANGLISFNTSVSNTLSGYSLLGKGNIPDYFFLGTGGLNWGNAIYGVFEDINPREIAKQHTGGSIRQGVLGEYPCRTLTVSWYKVPNFGCPFHSRNWDTYQIVLYEGTNVIDVYVAQKSYCTWNGNKGIIGIQNKDCSRAVAAPGRNTNDSWTAQNEAWRFTPISSPQYTITYYAGKGINGKKLGTGDQITINPNEVEYLTARLQFTAANGEQFDLRDTALILHTEVAIETTNKQTCDGSSFQWRGHTYTQSGTYTDYIGDNNGCYDKVYQLNLSIGENKTYEENRTICEGETYTWHGKKYSQTGTYYDRKKSVAGCDSIHVLHLQVLRGYHIKTEATICEGDVYNWREKSYTKANVYKEAYKTIDGCDSIFELTLTVQKPFLQETEAYLCDGNSYRWRGKTYSEVGVYDDSLKTIYGCDSIYRLHLERAQNYHFYDTLTICDGDTLLWHGQKLFRKGNYTAHYTTSKGCDSIYYVHFNLYKKYLFISEGTITTGGTYSWRGKTYTAPGQYYDSLKTQNGCDSVFQLNLAFARAYFYPRTEYRCFNDAYTWREKTYTKSGIYQDSYVSRFGTDSVYQLTLFFAEEPFHIYDTIYRCEGETFNYNGTTIRSSQKLYETIKTTQDLTWTCDSIIREINVIFGKPFYRKETKRICAGESYHWHGFDYTQAGTYYDEYKTREGCDSIYELTLIIDDKFYKEEYKTICEGTHLQWHKRTLTDAGIYYDSAYTVHGCDSVYKLVLTVEKPITIEENAIVCENEIYDWHGQFCMEKKDYFDTIRTINGCDSLRYILHLDNYPSYSFYEDATICEGEYYEWRGRKLTKTDTYYDRYKTQNGCDSIYVLNLTVHPTYFRREQAAICDGSAVEWHNKIYTQKGVYYDTLKSVNNCDSIFELTLVIGNHYLFEEEYVLCEGVTYSWHGKQITDNGIYYDSLHTQLGCDSIYILTVSKNPSYRFLTEASICAGDAYEWRDSVYTIDSIYYDIYSTTLDCDSSYLLRLKVHPTYLFMDTATFCSGEEFMWHDTILTIPGTYYDTLISTTHCDSIYGLNLVLNQTFRQVDKDTICGGETYIWREKAYTTEDVFYDRYKSVDGCDSVYELHLVVLPSYDTLYYDTICQGQTYHWCGQLLSKADEYKETYHTLSGCDSILRLHLSVQPTYFHSESAYLCTDSEIMWHGEKYNKSGVYYDSLVSIYHCDSVIELTLIDANRYELQIFDTICDGESYLFDGESLTESGEYEKKYFTYAGCDSLLKLQLYVREFPKPQFPLSAVCADERELLVSFTPTVSYPVRWSIEFDELGRSNGFVNATGVLSSAPISIPLSHIEGKAYTVPNHYSFTLSLNSDYCNKEQTFQTVFDVLYPSYVLVQKFEDVLAVQNEYYNGGFRFTNYQWLKEGVIIEGETMPYYYLPEPLSEVPYQALLTNESDGVAMLTCPIIPHNRTNVEQVENDITIYPTAIPAINSILTIHTVKPLMLTVYNVAGDMISQQYIDATRSLSLPSSSGIYLLHMSLATGEQKVQRIVIY